MELRRAICARQVECYISEEKILPANLDRSEFESRAAAYDTYKWYAFDGRFKLTNSNSFCESFGFTVGGLVGVSKSRGTVSTPLV